MDDRTARRQALSEWFTEFSVLWAVFPLLDRLVEGKAFDISVILIGGIILGKGDRA
jgi:hypothetical protein